MSSVTELQEKTQENVLADLKEGMIFNQDSKTVAGILEGDISPEMIKSLEEARDKVLGITWSVADNQDGTKDLIRDCRDINDSDGKEEAEKISYQIQAVNTLLAAKKVSELEENSLSIDTLKVGITGSITPEEIQKFNASVVKALKKAGVKDAKDKLKTARDFVSMDCEQFHVTTITKQKDGDEKDRFVIETDTMLLGLAETQKAEYESIRDSVKNKLPDWYKNLPKFDLRA